MLKAIFKQIILDFQEKEIPISHTRDLAYKIIPGKALALIGMRRTGKSTLLMQMAEKLLAQKTSVQNLVYINFVDERILYANSAQFSVLLEAYYELFPEKRGQELVHFFFDEIQEITGWEAFVDRLMRTEKCQVYLSGSSAKLLSTEIATTMRGRSLSYEVFPFSFREFLRIRGIDFRKLTSRTQSFITKAFHEYLLKGGFPEVIDEEDESTRCKILQEYYRSVLYRDLIDRHDVSSPKMLSAIMHLLANQAGCLYTINKTTQKLRSMGHQANKMEVSQAVDWMNDAYFFYPVSYYSESVAKQNTNPKKGYVIDTGMARALNLGLSQDQGQCLENLVFMELRRKHSKIFYLKDSNGHEIDFVYEEKGKPRLVQVTVSLADEKTRKREMTPLLSVMKQYDMPEALILTMNEEELLQVERKKIRVLPVWKFLIES